jgi:hypothetical protein
MGAHCRMLLRKNRQEPYGIAPESAVRPTGCNVFGDVDVLLTIGLGVRNLMQYHEALACQLSPTECPL